jgi:hypothetical protein
MVGYEGLCDLTQKARYSRATQLDSGAQGRP